MDQRPRTARIWFFWALALLLAAVVTYLGCLVTAATGVGVALFALSAAVLVAGVSVAVGAVAARLRVGDRSRQRALVWSLWSLAFLLAAGVITLGLFGIFATSACRAGCVPSIAYGALILLLFSVLVVASVLAGMGSGVAGVYSAAKAGRWGWFAALLAYLLGSGLSAVLVQVLVGQRVLSIDSPVVVLFVSPLLTPVVTMIYSLSQREQRAPA